ncbi:WhiB family transcriptional regulator [Streptosporangium carneum]|uniref:4Fe-4S Wbl-type domain-containing protein n=1 Tax=Streptosporangium carneum TaxID=47481 RepID=A0A9W6HXA1_9ACTN|nr:WhiB family transcriptional regulator [Streptosporangium carneum]GLK07283.1 hypothetical protein GCM10017600_06880 [Streptosporangium carneum]
MSTVTARRRPLADEVAHPVARTTVPACRGHDPELWFAHGLDATLARAVNICRTCPLMKPCRAYATAYDVDGVWGATTRAERDDYRRAHGIRPRNILGFASRKKANSSPRPKRQRRTLSAPAAPEPASEIVPTKHCPRCGTDRPLNRWYRNRATADRLSAWCKPCLHEIAQKGSHP